MTPRTNSSSVAAVPVLPDLDIDAPETVAEFLRTTRLHDLNHRWGVILAGGDGTRLRKLTRLIAGDDRPKQFCNLFGERSLVEEARSRVQHCIPPDQTVFALTASHKNYYQAESGLQFGTKLIQPYNRGTAPPIILSLLHIACIDTDATVAVLPSDHYYSDDSAFVASLSRALDFAETHKDAVLVLGAKAHSPETEFGWIELGFPAGAGVHRVRRFWEKPELAIAQRLLREGALWNTFIMVGKLHNFLTLITEAMPDVVRTLGFALEVQRPGGDIRILPDAYDNIPSCDFSRHVLTPGVDRLLSMRIEGYEWHDLGHPERVLNVLSSRKNGAPSWLGRWEALQGGKLPLTKN